MTANRSLDTVEKINIAVIGLGYVGLPLAVAFATKYPVLGFDIDAERISELKKGVDRTREADLEHLQAVTRVDQHSSRGLSFSTNIGDLHQYDTFIITVPTPIDDFK